MSYKYLATLYYTLSIRPGVVMWDISYLICYFLQVEYSNEFYLK